MINFKVNDSVIENVKLVIFDKDGTFIDIHKYWGKVVELRADAIIQYFSLSEDFFEPLCEVMGYDLKTKLLPPDSPVGLYARNQVQEILMYYLIKHNIEAYPEDIDKIFQEVAEEFMPYQEDYTVVIDEAVELIKKLNQNNIKMAVITSDSKKNTMVTIKKQKLSKYFEYILCAEDSKTPKTSGEIVKTLISKTKTPKKNIICIGDTYDDFLMAKNSDIKACINVATGVRTKAQLINDNELCVNSLSEIELFN